MLITYLIYSLFVNVTREDVSKSDKFKYPLYGVYTYLKVFSRLQKLFYVYEYIFLTYNIHKAYTDNVHKYYTDPIGSKPLLYTMH